MNWNFEFRVTMELEAVIPVSLLMFLWTIYTLTVRCGRW